MFALALAVRLAFLSRISDFPLFFHPVGDPEGYVLWARHIAAGDWMGKGVFYQAPLYPYFLALVYLAKPLAGTPQLIQAVLDAASCALVAAAGRVFFSRPAGLIAGSLLCFFPMNLFFTGLLQKTTLTFFLFSLLLYGLALCRERPTGPRWFLPGLALGLLALTRENALALFPVIMLWLFVHFRGQAKKKLLGWYALFCLGLFTALFPVALRNQAAGGAFVLTTSQFGANFYYGNNARATGVYEPVSWGRATWRFEQDDARALAEEAAGKKLTDRQVNRWFVDRTIKDIRNDPARWLRLMAFKSVLVLNRLELGDSQDVYTQGRWSGLLRFCLVVLPFSTLLGLAGFGLAATWRDRETTWVLMAIFAAFWASVALFFYFDRYRFPLAAVLALFSGGGLAALPSLLRERKWRTLLAGLLLCGALVAMSRADLLYENRLTANTWRNMALVAARNGDEAAAGQYFRNALSDDPRNAKALEEYGEYLDARGGTEEAKTMLRRALAERPDFSGAHWAMAVIALREDRPDLAAEHLLAASRDPRFRQRAFMRLAGIAYADGDEGPIAAMAEKAMARDPLLRESLPDLLSLLTQAAQASREKAEAP